MLFKRDYLLGYQSVLMRASVTISCIIAASCAYGRNDSTYTTSQNLTLRDCIDYATTHQPALNQSLINVSIARATNAINLSGWLPQVGASGSFTHYFELPTAFQANTTTPGGQPIQIKTGIQNLATPQLNATQTIFNPSLIYAAKAAPIYIEQARQITDSTKINLVATVSKSFYSLLLTLEQIDVLRSDTIELRRNVTDAYHQYVGGIVDETDYDEATITLNNTLIQLKQATDNVAPQYAALKQLIGFPTDQNFNVSFDTSQMVHDINIDTTGQLQFEKRIEYKQLLTAKKLQQSLVDYYNIAFLPTIGAFYNYTYEFENKSFSDEFTQGYPYSSIGISFTLPIFTGFARLENIHKARLQQQLLDWTEVNLKSQINYEYTNALANYKSNIYSFHTLQQNVALAKKVYFIVELQYKQGIVAYLNVITAQTNLIASENGYINALFQALSSKIDLEKAMGDIAY